MKSFLGNFYRHLAIFFLSHWTRIPPWQNGFVWWLWALVTNCSTITCIQKYFIGRKNISSAGFYLTVMTYPSQSALNTTRIPTMLMDKERFTKYKNKSRNEAFRMTLEEGFYMAWQAVKRGQDIERPDREWWLTCFGIRGAETSHPILMVLSSFQVWALFSFFTLPDPTFWWKILRTPMALDQSASYNHLIFVLVCTYIFPDYPVWWGAALYWWPLVPEAPFLLWLRYVG